MTEQSVYICDICGEVFEDFEKCENHEFVHKMQGLLEHAKFFDDGFEIDFDEHSVDPINDFFERVDAIICDDKATAMKINELYDTSCLETPFSVYSNKEEFYQRAYLDKESMFWHNADDVISEIKRKFGK